MLGQVHGAQAQLEAMTGHESDAVKFGELSLACSYRAMNPEDCGVGHHNLAILLEGQGSADPKLIQAHRLAAAALRLPMRSGLFPTTLAKLAEGDLPAHYPPFDEVAQRVESIEGVRFRELYNRLPPAAPSGDATLAAIWQIVADQKQKQAGTPSGS